MTLRFASNDEITNWNKLILANPDEGNIFQGKEFAEHKVRGGWRAQYLKTDILAITVLEKSVPLLGKLWYLPKGPGITSTRELDEVLPHLTKFAQKQRVFMIKIEPELIKQDETLLDLMKLGLIRARPIQPNFSTITVDLTPSLDEIMAGLNQKGRHAIKRAQRDGVTVKRLDTTEENCEVMYRLLAETAAGSFGIRSYEYYKAFWQCYAAAGYGQLFFAYDSSSRLVAAAFAITFGKKSTYKDGASVRERSVYGASHLLQWHVIEWAKSRGACVHDLCGAPPSHEINNPEHPHYGIGRFKSSFNKVVTDYVGAYDIVTRPLSYKIWNLVGQKILLRFHQIIHHESYF